MYNYINTVHKFIKMFIYNRCIYEDSHNTLHLGTVSNNIIHY